MNKAQSPVNEVPPGFPGTANRITPFISREITNQEARRLDVYYYISPKNKSRLVSLIEPCRLAIALEFEFDPDVVSYVERPRTLSVENRLIELCFWISRKSGSESFVTFRRQTKPSTQAVRAEERFCNKLLDAARDAGLALTIRKPQSLLLAKVANATRLELLPYVQAANAIQGIEVLVDAILEHMRAHQISSFYSIERSLCDPFDWRDVRSVTCLLIHRGLLRIDFNERLKVSSKVSTSEAVNE